MEQIQNHRSWILNWFDWNQSDLKQIDWIWQILDWRRWSNQIQSWSSTYFMGISPSLSPQHVLAHLDEFWWMIQSTGLGVSQISSSIGNCTQWDSDLAQLDTDYALMDSPSADFIWFHEDLHPPWAGSPVFCIYPSIASSSKLVRTGIDVLLLLYCCNSSF